MQVRRIARLLECVLADVVICQRTFASLKVNQICNQVDEPFRIRMHSQKAMCVTSRCVYDTKTGLGTGLQAML